MAIKWNGELAKRVIADATFEGIAAGAVAFHSGLQEALNTSAGPYRRVRTRNTSRGKKGSSYTAYKNPAGPGESPHKRTGWLQQWTIYELDRATISARIGVTRNATYGLFLELGTRKMRPRPFILKTLRKLWDKIVTTVRIYSQPKAN